MPERALGGPAAPIAVATGSRLVSISGQAALAPAFSIIGGDDIRAQTVASIRNLEALQAVNAS